MRTAPSTKSLIETFRITQEEAETVRRYLHMGKLAAAFRNLPGFYGVEYVFDTNGEWVFVYVNSGDTYSPTVVRRNGSSAYRISTVGDEVETLERKGVHVK